MNISQNTILITGGSAGIGFEMAKLFIQRGNKVIITGRNEDRLKHAASQLGGNVKAIISDISLEEDTNRLAERMYREFPDLNLVINNAALAYAYSITEQGAGAFEKASQEIHTNYLSVLRLNDKLLPILKKQNESAIVNVTSVVSFAPAVSAPSYSISKAALHAYSQLLRLELAKTSVKVFELMPPLVDTEFSKEIGGHKGIKPVVVAEQLLDSLSKNEFEIRVGQTADLYSLYLSSPTDALHALNGIQAVA